VTDLVQVVGLAGLRAGSSCENLLMHHSAVAVYYACPMGAGGHAPEDAVPSFKR